MSENNEEQKPGTLSDGITAGMGVLAFSFLVGVGFAAGRSMGTQLMRSVNDLTDSIVIRRTKPKKDKKTETES